MQAKRAARAAVAVLATAFFNPVLTPAPVAAAATGAAVSSAETLSPAAARARLLDLVNRDRGGAGLPSLRLRDDLDAIAGDHSLRMAAADDIFHNDDLFTAATKSAIGAATVGENVALNTSVDDAHRRLMDSPGHRANILSPDFSLLGISAVNASGTWFLTEVFIKPVSTAVLSSSTAPATTSTAAAPAPTPPATASPEAAPPATSPPATSPPATAPPATAPPATSPPATAPPATSPPDTASTGPAGAAATTTRQASAPAPRRPSRGLPGTLSGGAVGLMLVLAAGAAAAKRRHTR